MPIENESKYKLCLLDPDLGEVTINPKIIYEFTISNDALTPEGMNLFSPFEVTIQIKIPKYMRCKSRKRFIKLMMSRGKSRNQAELVSRCLCTIMPYQEAWNKYLFFDRRLKDRMEGKHG